ncbi:MAG: TonB-dependent receptor [Sphingobium sp.]
MRNLLLTGVATAAMIVTSPVMAQQVGADAAAEEQDAGGDIIVTARRIEERLQDVPISITAFSQSQLTDRNIVSAGDIAAYTPSLSANSRFGSEKTSFGIRGFNQDNSTAPSVGVYFADVPALRAQGGTTTANGTGPGAFFDLANVQVLKGPQGTLFGRNTSGGAVLLVPVKPTRDLEGYVEGSVGNYDLRRVQAVLNVPILDTLRVRVGLDRQTRDGYMTNVSGIGPKDFSDSDYWAGRVSVVADLTPDLENYFIGTYSKSDTSGYLPRVFECNRSVTAPALTKLACDQADRSNARDFYTGENSVIAPYQYVESFQLLNTTTFKASDALTIKNIVSYGEYRESLRSTVYGENLQIVSGPNAGGNGLRVLSNPFPGRRNVSQSTFTEELQFQGSAFDDRLSWQAGAYFESSNPLGFAGVLTGNTVLCNSTDPYFGCTGFTPAAGQAATSSSLSSVIWKYGYQDYGLYGQSTYKLSDHFSVTGGIRYTWDYYQLRSQAVNAFPFPPTSLPLKGYCADLFAFGPRSTTAAPNPRNNGTQTNDQCETYQRAHSDAPTWLIDIDYKPTDDILIYAKYARGYRQGQMRSAGYGRQAFGPEKIDNYEIGLKTSWRGPIRGTLNVAAYYNDLSDQQVTASALFREIPTQSVVILNAGKSRLKGIEVDGSLSPFRDLTFDFGYAYLDTEVVSLTPPSAVNDPVFSAFNPAGALEGYPVTYAPKNKYTITGTYTLPLDPSIGKISVGATFSHTDSQYATFSDSTPAILALAKRDLGILPPLDLLNLNLNWRNIGTLPIDLALFATNVTKKKYATSIFGGYASFGLEAMSVGEPRMYGLRLKYRFGD